MARLVGESFCRVVDELPEAFPAMHPPPGVTPDLSAFRVENVVAGFADALTGEAA